MTNIDVALLDTVVGGLSGDEAVAAGAGMLAGATVTYLGAPAIPWLTLAGGAVGLSHGAYTGARDGYQKGGVRGAIGGAVSRGLSEGAEGASAGFLALPVGGSITGYTLAKRALK